MGCQSSDEAQEKTEVTRTEIQENWKFYERTRILQGRGKRVLLICDIKIETPTTATLRVRTLEHLI